MKNVLLISEDTLKTYTSLNDNTFGKNILPAIKTSQDIELQTIIGSSLYNKLCDLVFDNSIEQRVNEAYKTLLDDYVRPYLSYMTLAHLVTEMSTKLANLGAIQSNDEHVVNLSPEERNLLKTQYTYYADAYCNQMQDFLKENCEFFPELKAEYPLPEASGFKTSGSIKPTLDSASSTGVFLGGYRSPYRRIIRRKICG